MITSGWGNNIKVDANILFPKSLKKLKFYQNNIKNYSIRGLGRSYGDSSLNNNIISLKLFKKQINIKTKNNYVECSSNCSLKDIYETIIPKGFFLPVVSGTKFVTFGGAIASDIHGKNHHKDGSFCNFVESIKILTTKNKIIECSRKKQKKLFYATCGGMGLTGIILSAKVKIIKINSTFIDQKTIVPITIEDLIKCFEKYDHKKYTIGWIDTSSKNVEKKLLFFSGNHSKNKFLKYKYKKQITLPFFFPKFFLNIFLLKVFNFFYKNFSSHYKKKVYFDDFFFPLDRIKNWNKFYGKDGFHQIQILLKEKEIIKNLKLILDFIYEKKLYSYLTTIKKFGKKNKNLLSFPDKGYTLTLDIKNDNQLKKNYKLLETKLLKLNCKVYLSKDGLMSKKLFKNGYKIENFLNIKSEFDNKNKLISSQYLRLFT